MEYQRKIERRIVTTVLGLFAIGLIIGELDLQDRKQDLADRDASINKNIPIGNIQTMRPTPKVIQEVIFPREPKENCLTTEELIENIEDAEMKGMDDDETTVEDLRWELK